MSALIKKLTAPNGRQIDLPTGLFINNEFVAGHDSQLESVNPTDESVICAVEAASTEDVDVAIKAARAAFESPAWRDISPTSRGALINKLADLIEADKEVLATLETWDNGKPYISLNYGKSPTLQLKMILLRFMVVKMEFHGILGRGEMHFTSDMWGMELGFSSLTSTAKSFAPHLKIPAPRRQRRARRTVPEGSGCQPTDHDELDEQCRRGPAANQRTTTYIVNISDLRRPVFTGTYQSPAVAIDHNQYIHNGLSNRENYGSGLRIIDVRSLSTDSTGRGIREVGFFDCYPEDDRVGGRVSVKVCVTYIPT